MAKALTARGRDQRWLTHHRGLKEDPPGSNWDKRKDGIAAAIKRCGFNYGVPWCGVWFWNGMHAGGVHGISSRQASVSLCEDDAKTHRGPFRGWVTTSDRGWYKKVLRGDGVVLFGYGVHIATVRSTAWAYRKLGYIRTDEGNTSMGDGSQSDGGCSTPRLRRIADIRGFCLVHYPSK